MTFLNVTDSNRKLKMIIRSVKGFTYFKITNEIDEIPMIAAV